MPQAVKDCNRCTANNKAGNRCKNRTPGAHNRTPIVRATRNIPRRLSRFSQAANGLSPASPVSTKPLPSLHAHGRRLPRRVMSSASR